MKKKMVKYAGITFLTGAACFLFISEKQLATPKEAVNVEAGVALVLEDSDKYMEVSSMEGILNTAKGTSKSETEAEAVEAPAPETLAPEAEAEAAAQNGAPVIEGYTNLGVANVDSYLNVREGASEGSKVIGKMPKNAGCEILEEASGWYHIQSGKVDGYVKADYLLTGDAAAMKANELLTNKATANVSSLNVRSGASTDSEILIKVGQGEKLDVVEQLDNWVKVALDNEEGYVAAEYVSIAKELPTAVTMQDLYYGDGVSNKRVEIVEYAKQFLGNRYVWGGTSLTKGTDCSGFTMSVYKKFGVSLPHSSQAQAGCGTKVEFSNIKPGDLVFYSRGSKSIGHVAMYIGNGQVIHASSSKTGIIISNVKYRAIKSIRRVLND